MDDAVACFVGMVLSEARKFIPIRVLKEFKGSHPWLNDACRNAILHKQSCEGTSEYTAAAETCTQYFESSMLSTLSK